MTRINVVPVEELGDKHLLGENKEITRVFTLTRNAQNRGKNKWNIGAPEKYTMGTGHVKFFYARLGYVLERYKQIVEEMRHRGFNPNPIPEESLCEGIDKSWFGQYTPTEDALRISRQRIEERLKNMS